MTEDHGNMMNGIRWRIGLSIVVGIGWLIFLILWLFFYAIEYSIYQNIGLFILSIFVVSLVLGIPWMLWGLKFQPKKGIAMWETKGFGWRVYLSVVLGCVFILFLFVWFFFFADQYNVFQNIAVFITSILIIGGVLGLSWAPWGMRNKR